MSSTQFPKLFIPAAPYPCRMIITISGIAGSGKSTVAVELAKALGLKHYSIGSLMREMAKEKGMSLLELGKLAEKDPVIDKALDEKQIELGREKDNFVIDSRLGWFFIPNSIKIFFSISMKEAARRVYRDTIKNLRRDERENTSVKQTLANMKKRQVSETKRYKQLYGVNYLDKKNFDIVVNSTRTTKKEKFEKTVKAIEKIKGF